MRPINHIYADLRREQRKLSTMPLGEAGTLEQSRVVDELVVEYQRAMMADRKVS